MGATEIDPSDAMIAVKKTKEERVKGRSSVENNRGLQ
jgi:hypothetical protein